MYDVTLSILACLRSNTKADVAWVYGANQLEFPILQESIVYTPGGGKIGTLTNGVFDSYLLEVTSGLTEKGRKIEVTLREFESTLANLPNGFAASILVVPAAQFPSKLWELTTTRSPFLMKLDIQGDRVNQIDVFDIDEVKKLDQHLQDEFNRKKNLVLEQQDQIICIFWPSPRLVIAGSGPIADAIQELGNFLGWSTQCDPRPSIFAGLVTPLSKNDAAIVMGHDVEVSSECLAYALQSGVGYIGALGSMKMQESRKDWLAYRDITDLSRINGPAGLDIGASSPQEIALSIFAEIVSFKSGRFRLDFE